MIPSLSQETITEYASEAQTIQEPQGTDYVQGVRVGKTIPAKWWNWLFRGATRRLEQAKIDAQNMLTELQNTVTDAGMTLDGSDNTQLAQAVTNEANKQIDSFLENKLGYLKYWGVYKAPFSVITDRASAQRGCFDVAFCDDLSIAGAQIQRTQDTLFTDAQFKVCIGDGAWLDIPIETLPYGYYLHDSIHVTEVHLDNKYYIAVSGYQFVTENLSSTIYKLPKLYCVSEDTYRLEEVASPLDNLVASASYSSTCILKINNSLCLLVGSYSYMDAAYISSDVVNWGTYSRPSLNIFKPNTFIEPISVYDYMEGVIVGNAYFNTANSTIEDITGTRRVDLSTRFEYGNLYSYPPHLPHGTPENHRRVVELSNAFILCPSIEGGYLYTLTKGSTVATVQSELGYVWDVIVTANKAFVIVNTNSGIFITTDGITFTPLSADNILNSESAINELATYNDVYYLTKWSSTEQHYMLYTSTDLTNWQVAEQLAGSSPSVFNIGNLTALYKGAAFVYPNYRGVQILSAASDEWNNVVPSFISVSRDVKVIGTTAMVIFYVPKSTSNVEAGVYIISSHSSINRVVGHTLYLR